MSDSLLLRGGRVIDPGQDFDGVADLLLRGGHVAALGKGLAAPAGAEVRDLAGRIVVPGLIDIHTHVYWGGTSLGVDAEDYARRCGVTTAVDTGSAGPGNFSGFRRHVIERSAVRILAYLHIAYPGIFSFSPRGTLLGEGADRRLMAPDEAVEVAAANRDVIVGLKARIGPSASGDIGMEVLKVARDAARRAGLPLMVHVERPPPTMTEILGQLDRGDILTHSFRPAPNAAFEDGALLPAVVEARKRGVWFDIGHGSGSFSFASARALLAAGFAPDTISSDVHVASIKGPAFDQLVTLSKFLCLGMNLRDVIARTTSGPAKVLGRPELGSLAAGAPGDVTVLSLAEGEFDYVDSSREHLLGRQRLMLQGVAIGGRWWHTAGAGADD